MATNALNAFNIDKNSGVNLNIYLGGFAKSWSDNLTSEPVTDVYGDILEARTKLLTNTALCIPSVNSSTNQRVDFFNYTNGFHLGNALAGKYRALDPGLGLTNDKVLLPVGLNTFEDVFSLPNNPTIKAGLFGRPVHYEMWFSGNYHVLTNSVGYNNYTYFGSNNSGPYGNMNDTLPTVKLDVSGKIRSYIAGIFKVGANLPNLSASVDTTNISDIVAGVRYSESNSMGYLQIIINGVIQSSYQTEQIYEIFGYLDTKLKGEVGSLSEATGNVNYLGVWVTSGPNSSTPFETNGIDFYTTDEINSGTSSTDLRGLIDTYLVKQGFYIDADTGLNPGTVYQNDVIRYKPAPMYALPAVPLDPPPCELYPNYTPIVYINPTDPPPTPTPTYTSNIGEVIEISSSTTKVKFHTGPSQPSITSMVGANGEDIILEIDLSNLIRDTDRSFDIIPINTIDIDDENIIRSNVNYISLDNITWFSLYGWGPKFGAYVGYSLGWTGVIDTAMFRLNSITISDKIYLDITKSNERGTQYPDLINSDYMYSSGYKIVMPQVAGTFVADFINGYKDFESRFIDGETKIVPVLRVPISHDPLRSDALCTANITTRIKLVDKSTGQEYISNPITWVGKAYPPPTLPDILNNYEGMY